MQQISHVPTIAALCSLQLQVAVVYLTAGTEVLDRRLRGQDLLQEQQLQHALQHAQREWQQVQQQQQGQQQTNQTQVASRPSSAYNASASGSGDSAAEQPLVDCVVHSGSLLQCYSDVKHALVQHRPGRRRQLPTLVLLEEAGDWRQGLVARSPAAALARTKQITAGEGMVLLPLPVLGSAAFRLKSCLH